MKANKLEFEQLQNVSGGGSTNEENSNGFRKTCVNSCVALVEEHFGSRFIIHPADLKSKGEYRREKKQKNWNSNN